MTDTTSTTRGAIEEELASIEAVLADETPGLRIARAQVAASAVPKLIAEVRLLRGFVMDIRASVCAPAPSRTERTARACGAKPCR